MDKREAKRLACRSTALLLDAIVRTDEEWCTTGHGGDPLSPADEARHREAINELVDELLRRGGPMPSPS